MLLLIVVENRASALRTVFGSWGILCFLNTHRDHFHPLVLFFDRLRGVAELFLALYLHNAVWCLSHLVRGLFDVVDLLLNSRVSSFGLLLLLNQFLLQGLPFLVVSLLSLLQHLEVLILDKLFHLVRIDLLLIELVVQCICVVQCHCVGDTRAVFNSKRLLLSFLYFLENMLIFLFSFVADGFELTYLLFLFCFKLESLELNLLLQFLLDVFNLLLERVLH